MRAVGMGRIRTAYRVLTNRDADLGSLLGDSSRQYRSARGARYVSPAMALKNSVWWAGLVLRANLMSTFPVDVVQSSGGLLIPVRNPGTLVSEPWPGVDITEHLWDRQWDLDSVGNNVGIIRSFTAYGKPAQVELVPQDAIRAQMIGGKIKEWRLDGVTYLPNQVWHERQYTISGLELGLSPLANASRAMGIYESAQDFALDWFDLGALPRGVLKNTARATIPTEVREDAKEGFKAATAGGDIFVTGKEWEWTPALTTAATAGFLDQKTSSEKDVARYVGVPAGMLDVEISTGNITYANATQANLQFLVTQLGPAVVRLQNYWSRRGLPAPWKLRLNTDALLRMDPMTKATLMALLNANKLRTPTELRALDNLAPYDSTQIAELTKFAQMAKPIPTGPVQKSEAAPWLIPS